MDQVAEIKAGISTELNFDLSSISPRETQEWAYFTKSFSANPEKKDRSRDINFIQRSPVADVSATLWNYQQGKWVSSPVFEIQHALIDQVGWTHDLHFPVSMNVLQVSGKDIPSRCVSVPPHHNIKCLIKLADGPADAVHPLDISVSTSNYASESLLALLTSGDLLKARTLLTDEQAEDLLYSKMSDPSGAAVGGYYLLKTGALERMHNWANNLANMFPWMPDGAIIHAWQLVKGKNDRLKNIDTIRKRLLEAAGSGLPVYTEGLRLLHEGLKLLSFHTERSDTAIEETLVKTKRYVEYADMSEETTTFTGISPDMPGIGFPGSGAGVVENKDAFDGMPA